MLTAPLTPSPIGSPAESTLPTPAAAALAAQPSQRVSVAVSGTETVVLSAAACRQGPDSPSYCRSSSCSDLAGVCGGVGAPLAHQGEGDLVRAGQRAPREVGDPGEDAEQICFAELDAPELREGGRRVGGVLSHGRLRSLQRARRRPVAAPCGWTGYTSRGGGTP